MNKQGFSLIELAIAMAIIAILSSSIVPIAIRSLQSKAAEKTALEMSMIQEASRNYYLDHTTWPIDIATLTTQGYLNQKWKAENPWRNAYFIASTNLELIVSTDVPMEWTNLVASHLPGSTIDVNTVSSSLASQESSIVTTGIIVAWSGTIADIPKGWKLCDGTLGTPDLRDKFIVGASQDEGGQAKSRVLGDLKQVGGASAHSHGGATNAHQLTIAEMPSHQHASWGEAFPELAPWGVAGGYGRGHVGDGNSDRDNYYYNTEPQGGNQGHSHVIGSDFNVPPFYALAFIMKL